MIKIWPLLVLLVFGSHTLLARDAGSYNQYENCDQCSQSQVQTDTLYSPLNKKSIQLSVLTESQAKDIFKKLKADEDIPFNYPMDGCYARAHKMVMDMDDMGIVSGKAFIEGELYVDTKMGEAGWGYHVASLVLVKKGNKNVPYIFDPAIFDHPVPYEEWKKLLLKKPKSKFTSEYFTKRFNYDPDSRHNEMTDYNEDDVENMKETNRSNARMADMMQMMEKKK